jgi:hypothetical protein
MPRPRVQNTEASKYPLAKPTAYFGGIEIIRNMTRHEIAFLNPAFLLEGQFAEYLPKMPSKFHVERLSAALGNEHHMIFALPIRLS